MQFVLPRHALLQRPQCASFALVSTHAPLHASCPLGQGWHSPIAQSSPVAHELLTQHGRPVAPHAALSGCCVASDCCAASARRGSN